MSAQAPSEQVRIYVCYAKGDQRWVSSAEPGLEFIPWLAKSLARENVQIISNPDTLLPGVAARSEIPRAIQSADVALLLLTENLFGSQFVLYHELPLILHRAQASGLRLIPILGARPGNAVGPFCDGAHSLRDRRGASARAR